MIPICWVTAKLLLPRATTTNTIIAIMVCTSHKHKHEQIQWFSLHLIYILFPYVLFSFGYFVRKELFLLVSSLAVAVIVIANRCIKNMYWLMLKYLM